MQSREFVKQLAQFGQEMHIDRAILVLSIASNCIGLQDIRRISDVAELFDQYDLVSQEINILVDQLNH